MSATPLPAFAAERADTDRYAVETKLRPNHDHERIRLRDRTDAPAMLTGTPVGGPGGFTMCDTCNKGLTDGHREYDLEDKEADTVVVYATRPPETDDWALRWVSCEECGSPADAQPASDDPTEAVATATLSYDARCGRFVPTLDPRQGRRRPMSEREGRPAEPNSEIEALSEGRCPACESEGEVERINYLQCSSAQRGRCTACDHCADPLAVRDSWDWERMIEDEHEQARRERERYESMIAEYQHSTPSLSAQCEP